ncbi:cardiolipin synthase [Aquimarina pacifica]|uniref:cardiolipin synthase n=1 Tax=Aquimarina pacifica TaxID=1296415 RepID=UPI000471F386|nr:cardiolipin synthase [Aquimarina pacifica]
MILVILLILYLLVGAILIFKLIIYGVRPTKTLAWLLAIFTIPVGGILLYLLLGRNRRKQKLYHQKKTKKINTYLKEVENHHFNITNFEYNEHQKLIELISKNSGFTPSSGNKVNLLKNGETTFEAIFNALKKATHFINIQYYIFEEGELTDSFFALFKEKVKEGVQIRILYDGIGSISLSKDYINKLKKIGVQVYSFLPMKFGKFLSSINYRNHRKIIVIDTNIAFTGGINVSDKYVKGDRHLGIWNDMHLQLEGPIVNSLQAVFAMDWHFITNEDHIFNLGPFPVFEKKGKASAQVVQSGPDSDFSAIRQLFFSMITDAKDYIYITNPYIIPGDSIIESLQVAALSGVDVRMLLSNNSDNQIVRWCVRSYFETLLQAGVKIYLIQDGFLHSKTMVADDTISSLGTANMDIRSFDQNYEVNVVIFDDNFALDLKNNFIEECSKSIQLNYSDFSKRPWLDRLKEGIAKVFSPVL